MVLTNESNTHKWIDQMSSVPTLITQLLSTSLCNVPRFLSLPSLPPFWIHVQVWLLEFGCPALQHGWPCDLDISIQNLYFTHMPECPCCPCQLPSILFSPFLSFPILISIIQGQGQYVCSPSETLYLFVQWLGLFSLSLKFTYLDISWHLQGFSAGNSVQRENCLYCFT